MQTTGRSISTGIGSGDTLPGYPRQQEPARRPMRRPRLTIARWMGFTAILAVNAGLVRAYVVQEMFCGGILIFMALQLGLWCLLHSQGRLRHFWSGFEVAGMVAVLVLSWCEFFP